MHCSPKVPTAAVCSKDLIQSLPMQGTKAAPGMVPQALAMLFAVRTANMVKQLGDAVSRLLQFSSTGRKACNCSGHHKFTWIIENL